MLFFRRIRLACLDRAPSAGRFQKCLHRSIVCLGCLVGLWAGPASAQQVDLQVLKTGLGEGSVTSDVGAIACGAACDGTYFVPGSVQLAANPARGSVFAGWSGSCEGGVGAFGDPEPCRIDFAGGGDRILIARFEPEAAIVPLEEADLDPEALQAYLENNPQVDSPAKFLAALPQVYREDWVLVTRSESLQTGTAQFPRILLSNGDATRVFTLGMVEHASYPGAHRNAIEYMQWDEEEKNFRFHEVVLARVDSRGVVPERLRGVKLDDFKCYACHSTGNVPNDTAFPGTTGRVPGVMPAKGKPNWDTYDSWGGAMPFNRDRIYQGSLEEVAFRRLFNLWNWRGSADFDEARQILEQLALQPSSLDGNLHSITRNWTEVDDARHLTMEFGSEIETLDETTYSFGEIPPVPSSAMTRSGPFLTLQVAASDNLTEGRAVHLFDRLGGTRGNLNAKRVADELIRHRFATGSVPIDVRPLALAITNRCIVYDDGVGTVKSEGGAAPLDVDIAFFDARSGMSLPELIADTRARAESLPDRKARIQRLNLDREGDIYLANGSSAPGLIEAFEPAPIDTSIERIREEVFRRPVDLGEGAATVDDKYVDREDYTEYGYRNTEIVSLYRYFLEPLGVAVDSWSTSVRGRSRTYTFGDVLDKYRTQLRTELRADLLADPFPGLGNPDSCAQLVDAIEAQFAPAEPGAARSTLPAPDAPPTFTDVQRIFNRTCIECHGGLDYPPFSRHESALDLSEIEAPGEGETRFSRSHAQASRRAVALLDRVEQESEDCPGGMMPCGGPALSQTDVETLRRWVEGGTPRTSGDPHIQTVDGVNYDFQAAGEFTLLRGENFELQVRQVPVPSGRPLGPDRHTGLTSCVSVNGAVALEMDGHRVTYQPPLDRKTHAEALELRIDGDRVPFPVEPLELGPLRLRATNADGGLQIEGISGSSIVVTPRYWRHQEMWIFNLDLRRARASDGLMGSIAPGHWLPAEPDGLLSGPRPDLLTDRYEMLYSKFGEAWRVTPETTLFDYAPGEGPWTFHERSWPLGESPDSCEVPDDFDGSDPRPAQTVLPRKLAEAACSGLVDEVRRANCALDVEVTGEVDFAAVYREAEFLARNQPPSRVKLLGPIDFADRLPTDGMLRWASAKDPEGGKVAYSVCLWPSDAEPSFDSCRPSYGTQFDATSFFSKGPEPGMAYFWRVFAEDESGARSESETWRFEG